MAQQQHDYHLVDPSPWPLLGSFAAFILAVGAALLFHPDYFPGLEASITAVGIYILLPGTLLILACMYVWWGDIIKEAFSGYHKPVVQLGLRYGMVLFIVSEVMFFAGFFWSFFHSAIVALFNNATYPPPDIIPIPAFDLPLINTLILLLSSCTLTWAYQALLENDRRNLIIGMVITILLGMAFTGVQIFEYTHASFGFSGSNYAGVFFMATGFHGAHVVIGLTFLIVTLFRVVKGHFSASRHFGFEAAAWYWQFVDVVWLFLFLAIYWWGGR